MKSPDSQVTQSADIVARTYGFSVRVMKMARALPKDAPTQVIARQVARTGTSIGANVEEAQGAHSRADFTRRMNIARTEARETLYWLRLLVDSGVISAGKMRLLITEADELTRILVSIVKKLRA